MAMLHSVEIDELIDPTGVVFNLTNGRTRSVLSEAGGGIPPIGYIVSSGPYQDGATLRGFRLQPRVYQMLVRWSGCSREQYWAYRARLIDMVRPNRQVLGQLAPLTLRKYMRDQTGDITRDLYVMIAQGPEFAARDPQRWDENGFSEVLRFIAHDPTWYDGSETVVSVIPTSTDNLIFPITFPIVFGGFVVNSTVAVTYAGNWPAYPTITITGPLALPTITNVTTGEVLELSYTMAAGERVTFDLQYGVKSVFNNFGANLIGYLTEDSDLATFHLEPDPGAPGGVNQLTFTGGSSSGATQFGITYNNRWIGI